MGALPFWSVDGRFDDAVGDAGSDDAQCVPQPPVENSSTKNSTTITERIIIISPPMINKNSKSEYRYSKWFGQLTILNQVEGQIQITKIQMIKTHVLNFEH